MIVAFVTLLLCAFSANAASAAEVRGAAFKDINRDGVMQPLEEPLVGKEIYAFDSTGRAIGHAPTDATGHYVIPNLPAGVYDVRYGTSDWWELWQDWAPSTTGSERPVVTVQLTDTATVDFGWRPIVRSTDVASPISTYLASDGLRINSYDDVVSARQLYDALALGSLRGAEAPLTTIRFDLSPTNYCSTAVQQSNGVWGNFKASCYIAYIPWLDSGDPPLFHEYGHAWSLYNTYIVQQDPDLHAYLRARGLDGDPRLGSNSAWSAREMVAEDYRQLFGSASAAARPQANADIPPAAEVPGLRDFLSGLFMQSPVAPPPTTPPPLSSTFSTTIHVSGMQASAAKTSKSWSAIATVAVADGSGAPVAAAVVTVRWSNSRSNVAGQVSCTTESTGTCTASVDLSTKLDSVALAVSSVAKDGMTYASDANVGAGPITVKRPK